MDDEALNQKKEYDLVINERDILGTQLIRRNDELALLYEKVTNDSFEIYFPIRKLNIAPFGDPACEHFN